MPLRLLELMCVEPKRDRWARVPKLTLNRYDVKAKSDQPAAVCVPQIMKADGLSLFALVGIQASPIAGRSEVTSGIPL